MFIEFTNINREKCFINAHQILFIKQMPSGSTIIHVGTGGDDIIVVPNPYDEVKQMIMDAV